MNIYSYGACVRLNWGAVGRRKTRQVHSVTVSRRQTPSNTESVCSGDNFGAQRGSGIDQGNNFLSLDVDGDAWKIRFTAFIAGSPRGPRCDDWVPLRSWPPGRFPDSYGVLDSPRGNKSQNSSGTWVATLWKLSQVVPPSSG
jgi:hypothetical protein